MITYFHLQKLKSLVTMPQPGSLVCVNENIYGHKDPYRARVLETSLSGKDFQVRSTIDIIHHSADTIQCNPVDREVLIIICKHDI